MEKRIFKIIMAITLLTTLIGCGMKKEPQTQKEPLVELEGFHMGTVITEKVYGDHAQEAANEVMNWIAQLESMMTINTAGSEIDNLNDAAGKNAVKLSPESMTVIETAQKFGALSQGTFDITIGPLVKSWGIMTDHPKIPGQNEIDSLLKLVDYKTLKLDKKASTARLAKQGQIVDLGGIAKGYAGDEAIRIYKKFGIKNAYINLGGNVVVLGHRPDGAPWNIGVQNPRDVNGKIIGILKVADKAVVSSGDYERFFMKDNKRYHHILDPRTGYPADSGLIGTTIIADRSIDADALSTSVFILGLEKGMALIESLDGVEAIFITSDKKVYSTSGVKNIFTFDDESKEYNYVEKR